MMRVITFLWMLFVLASPSFLMAAEKTSNAIEIPFRWTPGQIEIQVSIEGRPNIWCILDSGAEFSMLDEEVGKALKLGPIVQRNSREHIDNLTLRIGPVTLQNQTLTLWALDNFRRQKREIRGVIGCELFERYVVTLDFQKHVVVLNEPQTFHPNPTARQLPITFSGRLPVIQTNLRFRDNLIPAKLMVDTGASQAVVLRYPFATEHRLFGPNNERITSDTVATGQRGFITLPIQELILDRWKFSNPGTEAYGSPAGAGGYTGTDGILGNDILRNFRVTFDYLRKRLILEETQGK